MMGHPSEDLNELIDVWLDDPDMRKAFKHFKQDLDEYLNEKEQDIDSAGDDVSTLEKRCTIPDEVCLALVQSGALGLNRASSLELEDLWEILAGDSWLLIGRGHQ